MSEFGNLKSKTDFKILIKNSDLICDLIRYFFDHNSSDIQFIISTYPQLFEHEDLNVESKLLTRSLAIIDVNRYRNVNETKELILGLLKKGSDWHKILVERDLVFF